MTWDSLITSQTVYQSLIERLSKTIWLSSHWSEIFLFAIAIYAVLIILLWSFHNLIKRHHKNNQQKFVLECDQIIAKFAQEQYNSKYPENINISLMEWLFQSNTKNYFLEKNLFEKNIKDIETKIWKTIVDQQQRSSFYRNFNKTKASKIFSKIVWRLLTIITLWIYKIFM
jgi:hypothetical protein